MIYIFRLMFFYNTVRRSPLIKHGMLKHQSNWLKKEIEQKFQIGYSNNVFNAPAEYKNVSLKKDIFAKNGGSQNHIEPQPVAIKATRKNKKY